MLFRQRLISSLKAFRPVLEEAGVLVVGSQVPNLLEPGAACTLVVSQDVDIGVPVSVHKKIKRRLKEILGFHPSPEEPSVWVPESDALIEVNLVGMDSAISGLEQTYVLEDAELPMLVFGALSLLRPGGCVEAEGILIPVPKIAGLMVEKLLTERAGEKGQRDLLVALGLLLVSTEEDLQEAIDLVRSLPPDLGHSVLSNLTIMSLLEPIPGMPDPGPQRGRIARLIRNIQPEEEGAG